VASARIGMLPTLWKTFHAMVKHFNYPFVVACYPWAVKSIFKLAAKESGVCVANAAMVILCRLMVLFFGKVAQMRQGIAVSVFNMMGSIYRPVTCTENFWHCRLVLGQISSNNNCMYSVYLPCSQDIRLFKRMIRYFYGTYEFLLIRLFELGMPLEP